MEEKWETKITKIEPNSITLRGYKLDELMGRMKFSDVIYLLIKGDLPNNNESRMFEAILVSSVDHGVTPPSSLATRNSASTGAPINSALAAGILSINKFHGGAIETCMETLISIKERATGTGASLKEMSKILYEEKNKKGEKFSGFGHRIHTDDPRTKKLFVLSKELNIAKIYVEIVEILKQTIDELSGKNLPINVDGALGAILLDMGFKSNIANGFFILSRIPGLIAHYLEEVQTQKPMRKIDSANHIYTGNEGRRLL